MEIFHPSFNRRRLENWLTTCDEEIYIFTPFFTRYGLQIVENHISDKVSVNLLVRGVFDDYVSGALSITALKRALHLKWKIKRYKHLHAKVYFDSNELFFGSVNLTRRGLGYPPVGNFELLAKIDSPKKDLIDEINLAWSSGTDMDYEYILKIENELDVFMGEYEKHSHEFEIINDEYEKHKKYSLRHIVQSESIQSFYNTLCSGGSDDVLFNHDYNLLQAEDSMKYEELLYNFLEIELIRDFLEYVGEGRFFGELRKWLIYHVEDVPTPSREDFNTQLNKLYDLVVEATQGKYRRITPGRYSEKLEKLKE